MPFLTNYFNHAQSLTLLLATLEMASIQAGRSIGLGMFCALLGGLPLIDWITRGLTGQQLSQIGTGNVSVSAAFYHGGRWVGILAVLSEAFKGITAVLIARYYFSDNSAWEIVALIALVLGRYGIGRGAGTTNVVWGFVIHDWVSAALIFLLGGISFTILRERQLGRLGVLVLLPLITTLRHPQNNSLLGATVFLSLLLAWIYQTIPDDLNLSTDSVQDGSQQMFRFFRGDRAILSLDQPLEATKVGQKAATLSQLQRWGYPVPPGWVLPPGDDPAPLMQWLQPTAAQPLAVRSSAIGEDSAEASAAGQYESILGVTSRQALKDAILRCQASYSLPHAVQYRLDRGSDHQAMAVLIQIEVKGGFSGVAFSRDPISRQGEAIVVEALPGTAKQVVSGQVTPEQYRVWVEETDPASWILPSSVKLEIEGSGDVPLRLIEQVAYLSRHLEARYHGIPQDIEWSYDGQQLWLLQARPVTTLLPIWTRKIAAEVIPGLIHPLTWSVNRPLTCGVWGEIFTLVLGKVRGLDFNQTATLHNSSAYFNASLLGEIFLRMGLPPESLEFLTRGAKFSKPPIQSTLQNLPGLLRLLGRELKLEQDFARDQQRYFIPGFAALDLQPLNSSPQQVLDRIDQILELLRPATYYSIFAPLSLALRQAIFKVNAQDLDNGQTPEVASLRSIQALALKAKPLLGPDPLSLNQFELEPDAIWTQLSEHPSGQMIIRQFEDVLNRYGYLSDVGTDIAVPTWKEDPRPLRTLFVQFLLNPAIGSGSVPRRAKPQVQRRLDLKGQVGTVYGRLLAELRWSFVALEQLWLQTRQLSQPGDIFFLKIEEIRELVKAPTPDWVQRAQTLVTTRRSQREQDRQRSVPALVYGNEPPSISEVELEMRPAKRWFQGIGASAGRVEGEVRVLQNLQSVPSINRGIILVVPYTDSGWAPLLAQAGGLIAEVGGRLSHGAIVSREYGIPAVMDIHNATQLFKNGQRVRIDGQAGTVELL
jgi:phosphohistidine swiveling domain-containing protein/glycerol-3-phosphate acyltransferase PlsY